MSRPEAIAAALLGDRMFSRDADGRAISRDQVCECGGRFTQFLLSERFLQLVENHSVQAMSTFRAQVHDLWVPVHCPPCERIDLRRQERIEIARRTQTREYDHAAD